LDVGAAVTRAGCGPEQWSSYATGSFHKYSKAFENSHLDQYSGLRVDRVDEAVQQPHTGCADYFEGNPIYQTQWVWFTADGYYWVELGTGHQCSDTKEYHYCGYGENGVWHYVWIGAPIDNTSHTFTLARADQSTWQCLIDGDLKQTIVNSRVGNKLAVGLESYAQSGTVDAYTSHALNQRLVGGPWGDWAGRDDKAVGTPEMCGNWVSDISWKSGENVSC
jgi:hypothetical protein